MTIHLRVARALNLSPGDYWYRVCGVDVTCDVPVPALSSFRGAGPADAHGPLESPAALLKSEDTARYETVGLVGGLERRVVLETAPSGARLDVAGLGRYSLNPNATSITLDAVAAGATGSLMEECTLGPPLILGLALRDRWLLHAAALVTHENRAVVIAGASGAGKSTLAAWLDRAEPYRRIADDLLGVKVDDEGVYAETGFPQLKLPAALQSAPETIEVAAVYLLRPPLDSGRFDTRELDSTDRLVTLAAHSVAARLFPDALLRRHLRFCSAVAHAVPMVEITYPHTERGLQAAAALVSGQELTRAGLAT